jgi:hypothetical protein
MYTKGEVAMGSHTVGVWLDGETYVTHRHEERVARSLAVFAARGVARRRRGWSVPIEILARRYGILSSRRIAVVR